MKQISYFKFFTLFPEFLDMKESNEIKIGCLNELKKRYRGKELKNTKLILYSFSTVGIVLSKNFNKIPKLELEPSDIINKFIEKLPDIKNKFSVVFHKQELFSLYFIENKVFLKIFNGYHTYQFMTEEELVNLKRKTIIESIKNK
jgi:hypothetical protein